MKRLVYIFIFILCNTVFAQDLVLNAKQKKDFEYFDYEDYEEKDNPIGDLVFLKGCSWYCGGGVKTIKGSSKHRNSALINYGAKNAHDFNKNSAWVEGKEGYGIGEFLEYYFNFDNLPNYNGRLGVNKILIANGYKKSKRVWEENSRVKKFDVLLNDQKFASINLIDSFEIQTVDIPLIMFPENETIKLRFVIAEVYEGTKFKDTAISLLMFDGVGVH